MAVAFEQVWVKPPAVTDKEDPVNDCLNALYVVHCDDDVLMVPEDMLADHEDECMDIFEALCWRTRARVERANTIARKQIHCAFQQPAAIATNCTGR